VLQGPGCLNYALVLRIDETGPTRGIGETNRLVMDRHARAMETITGRPVAVRGHTDLAFGGRKFSGNAQRRRRRFLLFHGTILLRLDLDLVTRVLALPAQRPAYRGVRAHGDFILNTGLDADVVQRTLRSAWGAFEDVPIFPEEAVRELVRTRYSRPEWNLKF
jgi:lipoate-protein ligase A